MATTAGPTTMPTVSDILAARLVVNRYLPPTPILQSPALNEVTGLDQLHPVRRDEAVLGLGVLRERKDVGVLESGGHGVHSSNGVQFGSENRTAIKGTY